MDRRCALSVIGVALTGCLGDGEDDSTTRRKPPIWKTEVDIDFETMDEKANVESSATIISGFTPEKPAQFKLTIRNKSENEREFLFAPDPPFLSLTEDRGSDIRAVLVPETMEAIESDLSDIVPETTKNGCWRALSTAPQNPYQTSVILDTYETVSNKYYLLAYPDSEGCLPPDKYKFFDKFRVSDEAYDTAVTISLRNL